MDDTPASADRIPRAPAAQSMLKRGFTMRFCLCLLLLFLATCVQGAPVSPKELEFLVRHQTPEAEILATVAQRKLLAPLTSGTEQSLLQMGASVNLITTLRQSDMSLSPAEGAAEQRRQMERDARVAREQQADSALLAQRQEQKNQVSQYLMQSGTIRKMLDGKLVRLDGDQLRTVDRSQIDSVKVFAFYYSAMWCAPCRKFTPQLIAAYQKLKEQYPTQFELIFVSNDRDEFNMKTYMKSHKMPWPAVTYAASKEKDIQQYGGESIPWLVAVAENGQPLTRNGQDKKYIQPEEILLGIAQILGQLKRN